MEFDEYRTFRFFKSGADVPNRRVQAAPETLTLAVFSLARADRGA